MDERALAHSLTLAETMVSPWLAIPAASVAMLMLAGHVLGMARLGNDELPASRRRIRTSNGLVMMFTCPMGAYALGIADVHDARRWTLAWTMLAGLVVIVVFLALLDMLNTLRLYAGEKRKLRRELREGSGRRLAQEVARSGGLHDPGDPRSQR